MALKTAVVVEPAEEPINERDAKEHMRIEIGDTGEDEYIKTLITAAREDVENRTGWAMITQTRNLYLDRWPDGDSFPVPYPPLQHYAVTTGAVADVTFATATSTIASPGTALDVDALRVGRKFIVNGSGSNDGVYTVTAIAANLITVAEAIVNEGPTASVTFETTILSYMAWNSATSAWIRREPWEIDSNTGAFVKRYIVDTNSEPGRIVLDYGGTWPCTTYPSNPIRLRYECGWPNPGDVPAPLKIAMKLLVSDMYENREPTIVGVSVTTLKTVDRLLDSYIDYTWKV